MGNQSPETEVKAVDALEVGDIVAVCDKNGVKKGFSAISRRQDFGYFVKGKLYGDGHVYGFDGQCLTGEGSIRPATEVESLTHNIKNAEGRFFLQLGPKVLNEIWDRLEEIRHKEEHKRKR